MYVFELNYSISYYEIVAEIAIMIKTTRQFYKTRNC
jgi:hypothetical protein